MFELPLELSPTCNKKDLQKRSDLQLPPFFGPISLFFSLLIALFKVSSTPTTSYFWWVGFCSSLFLGCIITLLSYRQDVEEKGELHSLLEEKTEKTLKLQALLEETQAFSHDKQSQAYKKIEDCINQVETFQSLLIEKNERVATLESQLLQLIQEKQALEPTAQSEQIAALTQEIQVLKTKEIQYHPYLEVRKQFEEKCAILHQTRKDLFELEGKYHILQQETAEKNLEPSLELKELLSYLQAVETNNRKLQEDIHQLEALVSKLMEEAFLQKMQSN
jgi:DNA repair exonuclease SbcCD ATPase subunit